MSPVCPPSPPLPLLSLYSSFSPLSMAVRRGRLVAAAAYTALVLSFVRLQLDFDSLASLAAAADRLRPPDPVDDVLGCREGPAGAFDGADAGSRSAAVGAACGCVLSGSRARSFWDHPAIQSGIAEAASQSKCLSHTALQLLFRTDTHTNRKTLQASSTAGTGTRPSPPRARGRTGT